MLVYVSLPRLRKASGTPRTAGVSDDMLCRLVAVLAIGAPGARIVVFSAAPDIRDAALLRGADEFVGKESPFHEVADVLRVR